MIAGFGERMAALRKAEGLPVSELAKRLHISSSMICRYETGERLPSFQVLIKIAAYFKVSTDFLLGVESPAAVSSSRITLDVTDLRPGQIEALRTIVDECREMNHAE